jgi:hypothetical protein
VTEEPRWWRWLAILALAVGVLLRAWPWLVEPLLFFEDGTVFFGPNYAQFGWHSLARPYAGYVPFGANVSAVLLCRLPTEWIPTAFVATASLVQLAAGCSLLGRSWAAVAAFWIRGLLAAVIVLLPIGSHIEFTTLAYMQWPMLCWLFLLLVAPATRCEGTGRVRGCLRAALCVFLTLSHPLAVVLLPLVLMRSVRAAQRVRWASYVGALLGYWLVAGLLIRAHGAPESATSLLRVFELAPALLVRVGLESVVGFEGWQWLNGGGTVVAYCAAILCWLLAGFLVWLAVRQWRPATSTFALACGWLTIAPLAVAFVARDHDWHDQWIVRYLWLSRVGFLSVLALSVTTLLPRWLVAGLALALAIALTHGNKCFHSHASGAEELHQFLGRLHAKEQRDGHRRQINELLNRAAQPPIRIHPQ